MVDFGCGRAGEDPLELCRVGEVWHGDGDGDHNLAAWTEQCSAFVVLRIFVTAPPVVEVWIMSVFLIVVGFVFFFT